MKCAVAFLIAILGLLQTASATCMSCLSGVAKDTCHWSCFVEPSGISFPNAEFDLKTQPIDEDGAQHATPMEDEEIPSDYIDDDEDELETGVVVVSYPDGAISDYKLKHGSLNQATRTSHTTVQTLKSLPKLLHDQVPDRSILLQSVKAQQGGGVSAAPAARRLLGQSKNKKHVKKDRFTILQNKKRLPNVGVLRVNAFSEEEWAWYVCVGTIFSSQTVSDELFTYVLTSAHCVRDLDDKSQRNPTHQFIRGAEFKSPGWYLKQNKLFRIVTFYKYKKSAIPTHDAHTVNDVAILVFKERASESKSKKKNCHDLSVAYIDEYAQPALSMVTYTVGEQADDIIKQEYLDVTSLTTVKTKKHEYLVRPKDGIPGQSGSPLFAIKSGHSDEFPNRWGAIVGVYTGGLSNMLGLREQGSYIRLNGKKLNFVQSFGQQHVIDLWKPQQNQEAAAQLSNGYHELMNSNYLGQYPNEEQVFRERTHAAVVEIKHDYILWTVFVSLFLVCSALCVGFFIGVCVALARADKRHKLFCV